MATLNSEDLVSSLDLIPHPEGGYFLETYRSGSVPMTSRGQTDFHVPTHLQNVYATRQINSQEIENSNKNSYESLTLAPGRDNRRPDSDIRRNCLTSIIWMPTSKQPHLFMTVNLSDHVHYYQGGSGFEFFMYNPVNGELRHDILGPKFDNGHKLQVSCPGGVWKCGKLLQNDENDYCLIGEAVAPGFDFHDFSWVTKAQVMDVPDEKHRKFLLNFVHKDSDELSGKEAIYSETYFNDAEC